MIDFAQALAAFSEKAAGNMDEVVVKSVLELRSRIVVRTPVDTGRLRANWQMGLDALPTGTLAIMDKTGAAGLSQAATAFPAEPGGRIYYLANNLPYARRIEHGFVGADSLGRVYNQGGRAMVGVTILEWPEIVAKAAASV